MQFTRRQVCAAALAVSARAVLGQSSQSTSIDEFFTSFTDEWMRANPGLASSTRYFSGEIQDRLDREISPPTAAEERKRIALARKGLADLRKFDRAKLTDAQKLHADVLSWQLGTLIAEEPYLDYSFPLQQMNGFNVSIVERFTVSRTINTEHDAENYIAALGQVARRMDEATAESKRLASKGTIPPKFILQATIRQMQSFADPAPAQSPFVTTFADKMATVKTITVERREALRAEAEKIVGTQIYPAWKRSTEVLQSQLSKSTDDAVCGD